MGIVEQGPGAIAPRESLVPDPHMLIGYEFWPGLVVIGLVAQVGVHHAQDHRGSSHQVGELLPQLVSAA